LIPEHSADLTNKCKWFRFRPTESFTNWRPCNQACDVNIPQEKKMDIYGKETRKTRETFQKSEKFPEAKKMDSAASSSHY
jgi:hypothetical protein